MPPRGKASKRSKQTNKKQERELNGGFFKCKPVLCKDCVVLETPYEFIQFEVLDEEEYITDDDEVWSEIDDSACDDAELSNINFDEDTICERLEEVNLKWRETHKNSNVRGAGTSRAKSLYSILLERRKWRVGMLHTCAACKAKVFGREARLAHYTDEKTGELIFQANSPIFTNSCCARYCCFITFFQ